MWLHPVDCWVWMFEAQTLSSFSPCVCVFVSGEVVWYNGHFNFHGVVKEDHLEI